MHVHSFIHGKAFQPSFTDDVLPALAAILQALEDAQTVLEETTAAHRQRFDDQILGLTGRDAELAKEPYLESAQAQVKLVFFRAMERLADQVLDEIGFIKAIDPTARILPQVEARITAESERMQNQLGQLLDHYRQRSAGVRKYIWHTAGDDKVRSSHAANDGKIFDWENPPETGHPGDDYNCRCTAEPIASAIGEPGEVEIALAPALVLTEEALIILGNILARATQVSRAVRTGILLDEMLGEEEEKPNEQEDSDNSEQPTPEDKTTDHGSKRSKERGIADKDIEEAIRTANESGNIEVKTGKYGTEQIHYTGSNGVTVVVETEGRNAGKIITVWKRQ